MVGGAKKKSPGPSRVLLQKIKNVIESDKTLIPSDSNFVSDLCDLLKEQNINFNHDPRPIFKNKVEQGKYFFLSN